MIKNTNKAVKDYAEAYKEALNVHRQATKHIQDNYKQDGKVYKDAMKIASEAFTGAVVPLKDMYAGTVRKDFEEARKALQKAVTTAPSQYFMRMLPLLREGKLSEAEIGMIKDTIKGNYMDMKMFADATGEQFLNVSDVLERLQVLEDNLTKFFDTYAGEPRETISYSNALMLNGSMIDSVDTLTDEFARTYSDQDFNNND